MPRKQEDGKKPYPARTPGPLGLNDQGDPNVYSRLGSTPGSTGLNDYGEQVCWAPGGIPGCLSDQINLLKIDEIYIKRGVV